MCNLYSTLWDIIDEPLEDHTPTTYPFWLKVREMRDE